MQNKILSLDPWLKPGTLVKNKKRVFLNKQNGQSSSAVEAGTVLLYVGSDFDYEEPGMFGEDLGNDYGIVNANFSFLKEEKLHTWTTSQILQEDFDTSIDAEVKRFFAIFKMHFKIL